MTDQLIHKLVVLWAGLSGLSYLIGLILLFVGDYLWLN